jgi:hypothetical protein
LPDVSFDVVGWWVVSTEELLSANIPDSAAYAVYFNRDRNAINAFDFEKLVHQHLAQSIVFSLFYLLPNSPFFFSRSLIGNRPRHNYNPLGYIKQIH